MSPREGGHRVLRQRVQDKHAGVRLDAFVAGLENIASRSHAERLIGDSLVRVDGEIAGKSSRLKGGEVVEVRIPPRVELELKPEEVSFAVRFQDHHVLIISKPSGVVVHPAPGHQEGTLVHGLLGLGSLAEGGQAERPGIVHRLDRDTSGLMVVARTDEALARLALQMKRREIRREYIALVMGGNLPREGRVEAPVGRHPVHRKRMAVTPRGREAITHFQVKEVFLGCTLLSVRLETGRTHQIRVHLAYIHHPVVGDPVYGGKGRLSERLGLDHQFLHASRLTLRHPITGEALAFEDPLPADLEKALEVLRRPDD